MSVGVIPIIMRALGTTSRNVKEGLEKIGTETNIIDFQKTVIA